MMRTDQTGSVDQGDIPDLKALSDFIYVSYFGTFKEWREFLSMKDLLPSLLSTLDIQIKNNEVFRYESRRLSFSYTPDTMKISNNSNLRLDFGYFQEQGRTIWDVTEIGIAEDKYKQIGYTVSRMMKPPENLGDEYQSSWENMAEQRFPYNRSAYFKDKVTIISAIYGRGTPLEKGDASSSSVLYTVGYIKEGNVDQQEMEGKLEMFTRRLVVVEKGKDNGTETGNPEPKN